MQEAQRRFVEKDSCAAYSTVTDDLNYPADDDWHYDSPAFLAMGVDFARQLQGLDGKCRREVSSDQAKSE